MTLIADSLDEGQQLDAYGRLRAARRKNRITRVDLFDAFYKAYLMGLLAIAGVYGGVEALGQRPINGYHLQVVQDRGAAFAGLIVALALAVGLRSGGRGGPLAFERADVRHLLLSPLDKRVTIRRPALRQLRHTGFLGLAFGAGAGVVSAGRLSHSLYEWIGVGALFGLVTVIAAFGVALLAGGLQIKRWLADLLALAVLGWSAADASLQVRTSPATWIGSITTWPLHFSPWSILGIGLTVVVAALGATFVNRLSIEAAERRSRLIGQLRFAATLQDVRTVMVIQRQLAQEHTRTKPWIKRRATKHSGLHNNRVGVGVYTRRCLAGMLRWPLARFIRLIVFVAIAALSVVGIWGGTSALVIVGGLALWLAGLDLIEGLAQEVDHPDRVESMARNPGVVYQQLIIVPFLVLFALESFAFLMLATFGDQNIVGQYSVVVILSTLCAVGGASLAVTQRPAIPTGSVETPEIAGMKFIFRMVLPPAISIIGLLPVVGGQLGWAETHTIAGMLKKQTPLVTVALIAAAWPVVWLRFRHEFKNLMAPPVAPDKAATEKAAADKAKGTGSQASKAGSKAPASKTKTSKSTVSNNKPKSVKSPKNKSQKGKK